MSTRSTDDNSPWTGEMPDLFETDGDQELIVRAMRFAVQAHSGQIRKGTAIPYYAHLMAVSAMVLELGGTEIQAAAGLLHDVLEDTPTTAEQLRRTFGHAVTNIVMDCSDTLPGEVKGNKRPWLVRKISFISRLEQMDPKSALVVLCDKLHNTRALVDRVRRDPAETRHFNAPPDRQYWYMRACHNGLYDNLVWNKPDMENTPIHHALGELHDLSKEYASLTGCANGSPTPAEYSMAFQEAAMEIAKTTGAYPWQNSSG